MRDTRLDRLAGVLVNYSTRVKKGDVVGIVGEPETAPLVDAVAVAVIKAGGHPVWAPRWIHFAEHLLEHGTDEQLAFTNPVTLQFFQTVDVQITLLGEANTKNLSRYDVRRAALFAQSRKPVMTAAMKRSAEGLLRWCGTQYPTHASAQDAEMNLEQYARFVFTAGLLHVEDPVAAWKEVEQRQARLCEYLQQRKTLRFRAPAASGPEGHDGTDLTVDVSGATWINCCGHENFPDGEVFAGPTLPPGGLGVDGHVNYTFPAVYNGREAQGVRLKFKGGKVVDASATKGEEFLISMLDQDPGARFMGEIAIGTNYSITEFSRNTLFDEKIGGTFHAAVGAGYPESGNANQSGRHWDMVCDLRQGKDRAGGTIEADGEVFSRDGRFLKAGWPGS